MQNKPKAFVIMSFNEKYDNVFEMSIKPAFQECGYDCNRVDKRLGTENIPNQIINDIIKADIVLADLSGNSPNVFYELGVSHSVGNKTLVIISKDERIPFDISTFRAILYENSKPGLELLKFKLKDLINSFNGNNMSNLVQEAGRDYFDLRGRIEQELKKLNKEINNAKEFSEAIKSEFEEQDNSDVIKAIIGHINDIKRYYPNNILISICGSGASGKSSFSQLLKKEIEKTFEIKASILATDSYMLSRADRVERDLLGFDPRANDLKQFYQDVRNLLEDQPISIRPYDHKTGEHAEEKIEIKPAEVIILEGIYSFFPELSNLGAKQLKYFIYADKHKAKELKFISDIKERGHSIYRALQHAVPEYSAYETYVLPHIKLADYIIRVSGYWKYHLPEKQDVYSLYPNLYE